MQNKLDRRKLAVRVGMAVMLLALFAGIGYLLPPAIDWNLAFRPAGLAVLAGKSPYSVTGFYNPPWTALLLAPLALLPEAAGHGVLAGLTLAIYALVVVRLGGKLPAVLLVLLSPPTLHVLLNGNLDGLMALGFILPVQSGLFFLAIKPQIGAVVGLYQLIMSWRKGGARRVLFDFGPFALVMALSLALFGLWPLRGSAAMSFWWNASLWPMSIPVGLGLFIMALRKKELRWAMGAAPCFSPYLLFHSWIAAVLALSSSLPELAGVVAGLWIMLLIRGWQF